MTVPGFSYTGSLLPYSVRNQAPVTVSRVRRDSMRCEEKVNSTPRLRVRLPLVATPAARTSVSTV